MAKVLIAGIGGGKDISGTPRKANQPKKYREANYKIEEEEYPQKTFITSALEEHYGINKTIFIGTTGSMWDNLYEIYCDKYKNEKDMGIEYDLNYQIDLINVTDSSTMYTDINSLNIKKFNDTFKGKVIGIVTKYGMNELEIFENFNLIIQLQNELKDGDEVYLDITHSFRSNAFWMFLVMNYLTDVVDKKITIKAITYGMLEATPNGKPTPVVNLYAFYKILQWIKGANAFKEYGNSYILLKDIQDEDLKDKMENLSNALNMNYIASLRDNISSLKKMESQLNSLEGPAALLIPKVVKDFLKTFDIKDKDYIFQAKLAKWHFEEKRYAMATININEAIINFIMDVFEFEKLKKGYKETEAAKEWLGYVFDSCDTKKRKEDKVLFEYANIFDKTKRMRNDIAHSLGLKNASSKDIENLEKYCNRILTLLNNGNEVYSRDSILGFSQYILEKGGVKYKK